MRLVSVKLEREGGSSFFLKLDRSTILGRGKEFAIGDRRVSRKHAEIIISTQTNSVILLPLSVNPSQIFRKSEKEPLELKKDCPVELRSEDVISLLHGKYKFRTMIQYEDTEPSQIENEEITQADLGSFEHYETGTRNRELFKENKKMKLQPTLSGGFPFIDASQLKFIRVIGCGSCGEVSLYKWRGTEVAVKKVYRKLLQKDILKEFRMKSDILRHLRHPNIVLFMGSYVRDSEMCIVTEYINRGSLHDVLCSSVKLEWEVIVKMSEDAAKGMNYLHTFSPPIIHRDLKSYNLLVDINFNVKVSDFGLAKFYQNDIMNTTFCGTLPWTAPEVFSGKGYSMKADVYSYGIVLWELVARSEPYLRMSTQDIIIGVTQGTLRPSIPSGVPHAYTKLLCDCWSHHSRERPPFSEILHRIETRLKTNSNIPSSIHLPTPRSLTADYQSMKSREYVETDASISPQEITFDRELHESFNAIFYSGQYKERKVVIKVFKEKIQSDIHHVFLEELKMRMQANPFVLEFFGSFSKPKKTIVSESLNRGYLYQILGDTENGLTWSVVVQILVGVAKSLKYLHSQTPQIIHHDVNPYNFMVGDEWMVKISGSKPVMHINRLQIQETLLVLAIDLLLTGEYVSNMLHQNYCKDLYVLQNLTSLISGLFFGNQLLEK